MKVMEMLLYGEDERFISFKEQYSNAIIASREYTGYGFFTTFNIHDNFVKNSLNGRIDDVMAKLNDNDIYYFILYITNGKIDTLEGFTIGDSWEYNYEKTKIMYCFHNKREYELN